MTRAIFEECSKLVPQHLTHGEAFRVKELVTLVLVYMCLAETRKASPRWFDVCFNFVESLM